MNEQQIAFYETMSNFELSELILMCISSIIEIVTILVSTFFAYIAVSYFVGHKLSKLQVISISSIYSVFSMILIIGMTSTSSAFVNVTQFANGQDLGLLMDGLILILIAGWGTSIAFMVQTRTRNDT